MPPVSKDDTNFVNTLLGTPYGDQLCILICNAEAVEFLPPDAERVSEFLFDFACNYRFSKDRNTMTAVDSAIRKSIGMMDIEKINMVGKLLKDHKNLSNETILEILKMIPRKFEDHPPEMIDLHKPVSQSVYELAIVYLFAQEGNFHSAHAAFSVESLLALRSSESTWVMSHVRRKKIPEFTEQLSGNLKKLAEAWLPKNQEASSWVRGRLTLFDLPE